jgi:uncharacterized membrane protein YkoI
MRSIKQSSAALAAVSAIAVLGAGVADAATHHTRRAASTGAASSGETVLTGTTLTQASAAAIAAVPGGTVQRASTENASDPSGAAYEVHVTKTDGSRVEVLEDSSFKVLSAKADTGHGPGGGGPGGRGNPNETVLTGTDLSQASAAALAAVPGGTIGRASTEDKSDTSGAAYEVHVMKSDGSQVEVLESSTFSVLSVTAGHQPGNGGPRPSQTTGP